MKPYSTTASEGCVSPPISLIKREVVTSQISAVLCGPCRIVCELQYTDANSAVLLHFVLKRQSRLCSVKVETAIILEVFLVEHQFRPSSPQICLPHVLVLSRVLHLTRNKFMYMQIVGLVVEADRESFIGIYGNTCRNCI